MQISIWKTLQHPNVLELFGASSASSDPPWFFVSPYFKNGSLVTYLKGLPSLDAVDLLKMIHEIAKGMAYLHGKGVLHGDLKVRVRFAIGHSSRLLVQPADFDLALSYEWIRLQTFLWTTATTASFQTSARAR